MPRPGQSIADSATTLHHELIDELHRALIHQMQARGSGASDLIESIDDLITRELTDKGETACTVLLVDLIAAPASRPDADHYRGA